MEQQQQPLQLQFLQLSTEISQPFIIPNISPISSPKLLAKSSIEENKIGKLPKMGSNVLSPLVVIAEEVEEQNQNQNQGQEELIIDDGELISTRKLSILDLN
ncbi:conserved hypothetical protein [Candida dubliniensis CD36]|uniref:Uncharacterized protein n=1 Tax=Candida dubliniensis (strain CD36 / ATCC MYA-646 / CBS 7987 / NCPF 3949 / NRRL Y-17841) TaxID=573826 RepID=B9WLS7_CANDC|nr:conserved hypothetical protein [Candida dubliniensis CD36]CAX40039.1 conserved hypothetical protein [Candida dubliniensis CD36]